MHHLTNGWTKSGTKALLIGFGATLALSACGSPSASETGSDSEESHELRAIGTLPIDNYGSEALTMFTEAVGETTDGSVAIEGFPAGQLYNDADAAEAIPSGAADMGIVQMDYWTGKSPLLGALYIPMIYDSKDHFYEAREGMQDALDQELQETANVKLVGWFNYAPQTIASTKEISTIEDFDGQKLRGWGEYSSGFLAAAGSDAVVMSSTEVYDAIQKGTIDGAMSAWTSMTGRSFYEVAPFMMDTPLQPVTAYAIVVNMDTWEKLSEDQQNAIVEAAEETDTWSDQAMDDLTAESIEFLKGEGTTITTVEGEAFKKIQESTVPELSELYLKNTNDDGQALLDIIEDTRG